MSLFTKMKFPRPQSFEFMFIDSMLCLLKLYQAGFHSVLDFFGFASTRALRINCETTLYKADKILPHENLSADNSYRLKTLDKNLGVRPIVVGEVLRKIIGKIITQCLKSGLKNLEKFFNSASARSVESNMLSTA